MERREFLCLDRHEKLEEADQARFRELVERRRQHEPIQYIVGSVPFCEIDLEVEPGVLIPRPETEVLVERLTYWIRAIGPVQKGRIVDVGVGSGAILLALLRRFPRLDGWGIDVSIDALRQSRRNREALGLDRARFFRGSHLGALASKSFDVVVSNPPYIRAEEIATLQPEVRDFEPLLALDGGEDGLDHVQTLLDQAPRVLREGGLVALELAADQPETVADLAQQVGYDLKESFQDLAGRPRGVILQAPSPSS